MGSDSGGLQHHGKSAESSLSQDSEIPDRPAFHLLDVLNYGEFQGQFLNLSELQFSNQFIQGCCQRAIVKIKRDSARLTFGTVSGT